ERWKLALSPWHNALSMRISHPRLGKHRAIALSTVYPVLFKEKIALSKMDVCPRSICGCVCLPESQCALVRVFVTIPIIPTVAIWIRNHTIKSMGKVCDQCIAAEASVRRDSSKL